MGVVAARAVNPLVEYYHPYSNRTLLREARGRNSEHTACLNKAF